MQSGWDRREDGELLAISRSDPDAFGIFYDRHAKALLGFFYRRTACAETAADLTAETFAQAFVSRHRFDETRGSARAWLIGIARHELSHLIRHQRADARARRRLRVLSPPPDAESIDRIEALFDLKPMRAAVRDALLALPESQRDAVSLRIGEELAYSEVARLIGITEGAARVRVARGLAAIAKRLEAAP